MILKIIFLQFIFLISFIFNDQNQKVQNNEELITLTLEVVIQDSEELFIQTISDAAITPSGKIIFTSSRQNQAFVFDENGDFMQTIGNEGRGPAEFNRPSGIEVSSDGTIFIHDQRNARISVWNSEFQHETEFDFMRGWNTYFITSKNDVFIWSQTHRPIPSGAFAMNLFKIEKNPWRVETHRSFEFHDHDNKHEILDTWSKVVITDQGNMIADEGTNEGSYFLYKIDKNGEMMNRFGVKVDQPMHTPERSNELLQMMAQTGLAESERSTGSRSSVSGGRISSELVPKPFFINLQIDSKNYLWAHRNKEFGQKEEIDIYLLTGEYITTVNLPASENEYRLLGIYEDKALFRVIEPDETPSLHVYRIEYKR